MEWKILQIINALLATIVTVETYMIHQIKKKMMKALL